MRRLLGPAVLGLALCGLVAGGCASVATGPFVSAPAEPGADIVIRVASAQDEDAFAAGKAAATRLQERMGGVAPHAIVMAECFEEAALKQAALGGVASVFPRERILGFATYGSFDGDGCLDLESVCLMGIGGAGIGVAAAFEPELGIAGLTMEDDLETIEERLHAAGTALAGQLAKTSEDRLVMVMADAHSPKNQFLVEGVQSVLGNRFPITGGSANKNAGQTFVYYGGRMYEDAALALMLSGDFEVALAGRQAKTNDAVIATAREAAAEARESLGTKPFAALAFNCAGRKGKLDRIEDERAAILEGAEAALPMFGCYCAGEVGPADLAEADPEVLSSGVGWHVMYTMLGRD